MPTLTKILSVYVVLLIVTPVSTLADSQILDKTLITVSPGMKFNYATKIDYAELNVGENRSPSAGIARLIEYSIVDHNLNTHILTVKMGSNSIGSAINMTMVSFGHDIFIVPDWNYWRTNITEKLNKIEESNLIGTSLTVEIIDKRNVFGYRIEELTQNPGSLTSSSKITEITYERKYGALNYQLKLIENKFEDGTVQIIESIVRLDSDLEKMEDTNNLNQVFIIIISGIFVLAISGNYIFQKMNNKN